MTPNEKAKLLVDKFRNYIDSEINGEQQFEYSKEQETNLSKKCALIVVSEIEEALKITTGHLTIKPLLERQELQMDFEYWENVKTEIKAII